MVGLKNYGTCPAVLTTASPIASPTKFTVIFAIRCSLIFSALHWYRLNKVIRTHKINRLIKLVCNHLNICSWYVFQVRARTHTHRWPLKSNRLFLFQGLTFPGISRQFILNLLSNPGKRQTNQQTNRGKHITSLAEMMMIMIVMMMMMMMIIIIIIIIMTHALV